MKAIESTLYECEICHFQCSELEAMQTHEAECIHKREHELAMREQHLRKTLDRMEKAKNWAKNNPAVQLLLSQGYQSEARILCNNWAKYNLWDCGTSSGWEDVLDAMVQE